MNKLLLCAVAFVFLMSFAGPVFGEPVVSSIHETKIELKPLFDYAEKGDDEMIKEFRKTHGVKVIVVDDLKKGEKGNPKLVNLNIDDDKEAVTFYESPKTNPLLLQPGGAVMFLTPYDRAQVSAEKITDFYDRPYLDQTVLIVSQRATRFNLIVAFVHFQLWEGRKPRHVTVDKVKLSKVSHLKFESDTLARELAKLKNDLAKAEKGSDKQKELATALIRNIASTFEKGIALQHLVSGTELEVSRLLIEHAKELKLTQVELEALHSIQTAQLQSVLATIKTVHQFGKDQDFVAALQLDEEAKKTYVNALDMVETVLKAYGEQSDWFDGYLKDLQKKNEPKKEPKKD